MDTFIKTLLTALLVYYGLKIILKLAAPHIMKYFSKKMTARFGVNFSSTASQNNSQKKEGEVTIDKLPTKQKPSNTVGQYVDYEEID